LREFVSEFNCRRKRIAESEREREGGMVYQRQRERGLLKGGREKEQRDKREAAGFRALRDLSEKYAALRGVLANNPKS